MEFKLGLYQKMKVWRYAFALLLQQQQCERYQRRFGWLAEQQQCQQCERRASGQFQVKS